ncbi:MAG: M48 family metallopeptidase [Spirochaetaceae bacterium]
MEKKLHFLYKDEQIPINLIRSNRKSMTLSINTVGDMEVRAPKFLLQSNIKKFITNQTEWINTKLLRAKSNKIQYSLEIGTTVPFLGEKLQLLQGTHKRGIKNVNNSLLLPENTNDKNKLLNKWYREQAREILTNLTDKYTIMMKLEYNKIFIKEQKTRWGSCSGKNNLNYNWKVILTDIKLIEYLVIHEVCHLKHLDHSTKFWNLVATLDPEFKKHKNMLQEAGYYLLSFLK